MNIYHLIILDASGSMQSVREMAVNNCNETIQTIRSLREKDAEVQHFFSLVYFNTDNRTNTMLDCVPIEQVEDLSSEQYKPCFGTPLYDAIGLSVFHLQNQMKKEETQNAIVTVITDGFENASTVFNAAKVKSLVEELKQTGWVFAFMGADQDAVLEGSKIGIRNTLHFEKSAEGMAKMSQSFNASIVSCCCDMAARPRFGKESERTDDDFFKEEK